AGAVIAIGPGGGPVVGPVNNAAAPPPPVSNLYRLHAVGRYAVSEKNPAESGRLDHVKDVSDPAGITPSWQPADGGFYYLTADHKLHMLLVARSGEAKN